MILDERIGPLRVRAWGLGANLIANAIALYGLSLVLSGQGGYSLLVGGSVATVMLLLVLAVPAKADTDDTDNTSKQNAP
ncbi:MAG: hypothetical protein AAGA22_05790 [Pseudomonadota bacterium]